MKRIITLICLLFLIANVNGQNTIWVEQGKAPKTEYGNAIAHDNSGNIYITGTFQDSVRFNTILLTASFGNYCAKYDTSGNMIWAKKNMGGDGVVFDGNSNLYLFSNESNVLQKVDTAGTSVWSKTLYTSSTFGSNGIQDVYVKGTDVYVTGFYSGDAYFGTDTLYNKGGWDIFIAKFNSSGQYQWAKSAGGHGLDKGYSIYVNNSNELYATGYFKDTANFESTQLISNGAQDMYLAKYGSGGNLQWVKKYGGTGFDLAAKITADDNGFIYATGRYLTSITFGTTTLNSTQSDAFIAKFDAAGNAVWAKGISGQGNDEEADLDYENGKLTFIATTAGNVTLGTINLTGLGNLDMCVGKIDTAGTILWAKLFGGSSDDEGSGIISLHGSAYFNGSFKATANFDAFSLTSQGLWDIVTGKLGNQLTTGLFQPGAEEPSFFIYPNPVSNDFSILFNEEQNQATITLTDILGNTIRMIVFSGKQLTIAKEEIKTGIYFITVKGNYKNIVNRKILIR